MTAQEQARDWASRCAVRLHEMRIDDHCYPSRACHWGTHEYTESLYDFVCGVTAATRDSVLHGLTEEALDVLFELEQAEKRVKRATVAKALSVGIREVNAS